MKKLKKFLSASKLHAVLFILMVSLVLSATVGATYASVSYLSSTYGPEVSMQDIGISLLENGEKVSWRDYNRNTDDVWETGSGILFANMLGGDKEVVVGKQYQEAFSVENSGTINEWVRVNIIVYWEDENGEKQPELEPSYIGLNILCDATGYNNGWLLDKESSTRERTVLYYNRLLYSDGNGVSVTPPFTDTLTLNSAVGSETTMSGEYVYDGKKFIVEIGAYGVQEHNGKDAIWSAWGRNVIIEGDTLTLA